MTRSRPTSRRSSTPPTTPPPTPSRRRCRRVAAMAGKPREQPEFPPAVWLPDYCHERYEPLFAAIQDTGLPICLHIGLKTMLADLQRREPTPDGGVYVPIVGLSTGEALGMWD